MVAGINATFTTGRPATAAVPDLAELLAWSERMKAERDRIDKDMVAALRRHIAATRGELSVWAALTVWAARLGVLLSELMEVLDGRRPPSWEFWEGVRREFGGGGKV